jgi:opacity protein-like surface antigen
VDITKDVTLSAGGQITSYKLGDGAFLNDMSFVTNSYSLGFGAKFKVAKNMSVNVAYFFTDYSKKDKVYTATIQKWSAEHRQFTRTNKALGVGLDIDF